MHPRPKHHFTPPRNWMNDPNGLIYHRGVYHLYYQHNPEGNEFGNISWGHATSEDLLSWEHQPMALKAYNGVMMYSGCTVVNDKDQVCAIYTEHVGTTEHYSEQICLAESEDGGFTFNQANRKVILNHASPDFRDPKVLWHASSTSWILCVSLPKEYTILFYRSSDLVHWEYSSAFVDDETLGQFWECPDLFPVVDENGREVWVLSLSGQNADSRSWGMFYYLGSFDGFVFKAETGSRPVDVGSDFYAGITFEGLDKKVMMAWCGNWAYADKIITPDWNGVLSAPRRLSLKEGQLYQELLVNNKARRLEVTPHLKQERIKDCVVKWSKDLVEVDRSESKLIFPEDNQVVSYQGDVTSIDLFIDEGVLELLINHGANTMTVRF